MVLLNKSEMTLLPEQNLLTSLCPGLPTIIRYITMCFTLSAQDEFHPSVSN